MATHYGTREKTPIEVHLENLQQMCILRKNATKQRAAVERILKGCKDEYEMSRKLHDLWTGKKTVEEFIAQYEEELIC